MNNTLINFDITEYLDSEESMAEYLSQVGMAQIAKDTGLGRESLYKAFRPNAKPRFDTVMKVIDALKIQLNATPKLT